MSLSRKDIKQIRELIQEELGYKNQTKECREKLEDGWYTTDVKLLSLLYIKNNQIHYGLTINNSWFKNPFPPKIIPDVKYTKATPDVIDIRLENYARSLGLVFGTYTILEISGVVINSGRLPSEEFIERDGNLYVVFDCVEVPVMKDGVWATVVEDDTISLNGKKVELINHGSEKFCSTTIPTGRIKIGCNSQMYNLFKIMVESLEHWKIEYCHHPEIGKVKTSDLRDVITKLDKISSKK